MTVERMPRERRCSTVGASRAHKNRNTRKYKYSRKLNQRNYDKSALIAAASLSFLAGAFFMAVWYWAGGVY